MSLNLPLVWEKFSCTLCIMGVESVR
jgi:hypothetical protein